MTAIWLDEPFPPFAPCSNLAEDHPEHHYEPVTDEYGPLIEGGLAEGGTYEVLRCRKCGRIHYCEMDD